MADAGKSTTIFHIITTRLHFPSSTLITAVRNAATQALLAKLLKSPALHKQIVIFGHAQQLDDDARPLQLDCLSQADGDTGDGALPLSWSWRVLAVLVHRAVQCSRRDVLSMRLVRAPLPHCPAAAASPHLPSEGHTCAPPAMQGADVGAGSKIEQFTAQLDLWLRALHHSAFRYVPEAARLDLQASPALAGLDPSPPWLSFEGADAAGLGEASVAGLKLRERQLALFDAVLKLAGHLRCHQVCLACLCDSALQRSVTHGCRVQCHVVGQAVVCLYLDLFANRCASTKRCGHDT